MLILISPIAFVWCFHAVELLLLFSGISFMFYGFVFVPSIHPLKFVPFHMKLSNEYLFFHSMVNVSFHSPIDVLWLADSTYVVYVIWLSIYPFIGKGSDIKLEWLWLRSFESLHELYLKYSILCSVGQLYGIFCQITIYILKLSI